MTTVETDEPLAEENREYLDMIGRDLGIREVLLDRELRGGVFSPVIALAIAALAAYGAVNATTVVGAGVAVGVAAVLSVYAVKWADQAVCVLRSGYTCHTCSGENERWEADS